MTAVAILVLAAVIVGCTWWLLHVHGKITEHQNDLALQRLQEQIEVQKTQTAQFVLEQRAVTAELQVVGSMIGQNHEINLALIEQVNARLYDQDCTMWDLAVRTANGAGHRRIRMP